MPGSLHTVAFGPPATALLTTLVGRAKAGDPLAPVTVVVPSATAGTSLRRVVASSLGGLVGVSFVSMPQLAASLAGGPSAVASVPPMVARALIRAAVRSGTSLTADPAVAGSAATEDALAVTFAELAPLDDTALRVVAAAEPLSAAVVELFRRFRTAAGLPPGGSDVAAVAASALRSGAAVAPGPVVVFLPRRIRPSETWLLSALAAQVPVTAVVGRTGDHQADVITDELVAVLAPILGSPSSDGDGDGDSVTPAFPTHLVRAPDPAEEAAMAARHVVAALAAGTRPERIAVLHRVRLPYLSLLHAALDDAGVPHHASAITTLAQTVPGRVLTALLDVVAGGFRRADVVRLWRAGPVNDPVTGRRIRASRWDRVAREAGIGGGLDQWQTRLDRAIESRTEWLQRARPEALDPADPAYPDHRIDAWHAVAAHIQRLAADLRPSTPATTWAGQAAWLQGLLAAYLDPSARDRQPEAFERIDTILATLPRLDDVGEPPEAPSLELLRRVLTPELDRPDRGHGRFGHGVAVARLVDAVGADFDVVIVVGAADGQFPPHGAEDPLLADRVRDLTAGALTRRGLRREEERRDLLAALAAAPARVLTAPRADPRDQRERQPAAWFVAAASHLAGRLVTTSELAGLRDEPWFTDVASFEAHPATMAAPATPRELDLGDLLAEHAQAGDAAGLASGVVATANPAIGRGLTAALARRSGRFDEWSGRVGAHEALVVDDTHPRSPTGLERYAVCPFRSFLGDALRVGAIDDPTEAELISPIDEGSLVHEVLETFVREHEGKRPVDPWDDAERDRLDAIAAEVIDRYEAEGRTGRPLLWGVRREQLRHQLRRVLDSDERLRHAEGVTPAAVEAAFGDEDEPPVEVVLANGRTVRFRGIADRIDRSIDGRRLVVYDYKTGSAGSYYDVAAAIRDEGDLTARGTKLQLPIYALAARTRFPEAEQVSSYYWFVGRRDLGRTIGAVVDERAEARFREVVEVVVDGMEAGHFPANPGDESWNFGQWTFQHCSWCEFDRICPSSRAEQWVQVRTAPELRRYRDLADPEPPEPAEPAEPEPAQ